MIQVQDEILIVFRDIARLCIESFDQYNEDDYIYIISELEKHFASGTLDWVYHGNDLIAAVRYNIINDGRVANILDLAIKPGNNGRKIIKYFIARGWARFPSLVFLRFERAFKDKRGYRMYRMKRFFNSKEKK